MARQLVFAELRSEFEKSIVLGIHSHKPSAIKCCVIIIKFKFFALLVFWLGSFPSDPVENSIRTVTFKTSMDPVKSKPAEHFPHIWMFEMKLLAPLFDLLVPSHRLT